MTLRKERGVTGIPCLEHSSFDAKIASIRRRSDAEHRDCNRGNSLKRRWILRPNCHGHENERHDLIELEVRTSVLLVMVMIVMLATSTWEIETRSAGSGVPTSKVSSGKLSWYWNIVHEIECK